ncbi:MAG TPA: hypothetical protein VKZ58_02495 [Longimicrobiales bacterium]|nr:hypothetical protein [Longimicrobiales bacterium]
MNRSSLTWPFRRRGQPVAPAWRQDASLPDVPRRWQRAPEPWERETEPFAGAMVLEDLPRCADDPEATRRLVARFAAVRLVRHALEGGAGEPLAAERGVAWQYIIHAGPANDAERRALALVVRGARPDADPALAAALRIAARLAVAAGHAYGAHALYLLCYDLATHRGWHAAAARAALAIARLAERGGGNRSARRWRRRAAVLARRANGPLPA